MRREEIQDLIRLVEESQINELEIWEGKKKIRISKGHPAPVAGAAVVAPVAQPEIPQARAESPSQAEGLASNLKEIVSPMVGTFYRAPAPNEDPFVEVGQQVETGQTVCIVEAMKLMNEIGSDYRGTVHKVLVENGQPVEYGQALFLVDTS